MDGNDRFVSARILWVRRWSPRLLSFRIEREPGFRFVPCFSRELPGPDSPHAHADVRQGYVQQHLGEFAPDPASDIAYLCGNPDMVDACFEALKDQGFGPARIRREKYVSSK